MLSNSQKEHLTYTAIGQVFALVFALLISWKYVYPGISDINAQLSAGNTAITRYNSTVNNGIDYPTLTSILGGKAERAELIKIIQSDPEGTKKVIQKNGSQNYLDWLTQSIGRSDSDKDILIIEKAKLNSIIPTMSPISSNIEEKNMTLKQYVKFIEWTILKKFNFESNVNIGVQWIVFWGKWVSAPENIGMFDFSFDFKGTNSDISRFIDYINTAGKPDILTNSGQVFTKDSIPAVMSNPLISLKSFSLQSIIDADNPTAENSGRATLRFYVRGISKDDLIYLRESIKTRQTALSTKISDSMKWCQKDGVICASYVKKLAAFDQKYREFERSIGWAKILWSGTDEIYALSQTANTIRSLEKELENILPKDKK